MKKAIIADIHGNYSAFIAVLEFLKSKGIKEIIHLGDIVGYGPEPIRVLEMCMVMAGESPDMLTKLTEEDIELASFFDAKLLLGNHDAAVINFTDLSFFSEDAYNTLVWTKHRLKEYHEKFLKKLPYSIKIEPYTFYHSTPRDTDSWYYVDGVTAARRYFEEIKDEDYIFVAHTHKPYIFEYIVETGKIRGKYPKKEHYKLNEGSRYIINVGSVGQSRDGIYFPSLFVLSPETKKVDYYRIDYDVNSTKEKLLANGFSYSLVERLLSGK